MVGLEFVTHFKYLVLYYPKWAFKNVNAHFIYTAKHFLLGSFSVAIFFEGLDVCLPV